MASPTQMVVGKGPSNLLIAEGLLKILRDLVSFSPPKSPTNSHPQNGRATKKKYCVHLRNEINVDSVKLILHL